jgi:hypothetical protein
VTRLKNTLRHCKEFFIFYDHFFVVPHLSEVESVSPQEKPDDANEHNNQEQNATNDEKTKPQWI